MCQLIPNVLIIGYGKIGKIKAGIWKKCGAHVFVSDITEKRMKCAQMDGFSIEKASTYNFIDICTPSSMHIEVLKNIISDGVKFDRVVIEKPLFNTIQEKKTLDELLSNNNSLHEKIIVNEQYYKSKVIKILKEKLLKEKVKHIEINMSKNRKKDNENGRFIDNDIGAYGIEFPHILAILEMLDQPIDAMKLTRNIQYIDYNDVNNQGIFIEYITKDYTKIVINSFLGDFKISSNNKIFDNKIIDRSLVIEGDDFLYKIILDPHPSEGRLLAELDFGKDSILIHDDMLTENISNVISNNIATGCKLQHAIRHSKQAMSLFNKRNIVKITREDTHVHNS
ncbi:Gfo/Idh/MocA family oxidoreductase [Bacillus toyonensis]|uniref:Gfo/Idh/MocA family oxidoreductase n=1 Tax=Bacillus toyonensis TaxID=155322 RepID=UPI003D1A36B1